MPPLSCPVPRGSPSIRSIPAPGSLVAGGDRCVRTSQLVNAAITNGGKEVVFVEADPGTTLIVKAKRL